MGMTMDLQRLDSLRSLLLPLVLILWVLGCSSQAPAPVSPVNIDPNAPLKEFIGAYNLFKDAAKQVANEGVIPYHLNTPLFTDYATKHRFVYIPPGQKVKYNDTDAFDFPVGTVLVKTFGFLKDIRDPSQGERLVETRLLIHRTDGWIGVSYLWNDDASAARIAVGGAVVPVSWTHYDGTTRQIGHIVPNMNQCKQCHVKGEKFVPLGPKARNLNCDYPYDNGRENQLVHWTRAGILEGAPSDPNEAPRVPVWDDPSTGSLEARARAYLDVNCAHCHNPQGPAYTSGLDLSWHQREPVRYGIWKTPVAAGRGSGGFRYAIHPGKPDESFLVFRMQSTDPGIMMPTLGRVSVHEEGVALIRQWIEQMDMPPPSASLPRKDS